MPSVKEKLRQQGILEGLQEGREKGILDGREKGLEEGRNEAVERVAKQMKSAGVAPKDIAQFTGLNDEQIAAL